MKYNSVSVLLLIGLALVSSQWACDSFTNIPNCASCTQAGNLWSGPSTLWTICTTCTTGFYLVQSACMPCPLGCQTCHWNGACTVCSPGFWINPINSTCSACPAALNCATCSLSGNIASNPATILLGQGLTGTGNYWSGPFVCTTCQTVLTGQPGWYVNSQGACVQCPSYSSCSPVISSSVNVTQYLTSYGRTLFDSAITTNTQLYYISVTCANGYYTTGSQTCASCGANCFTCAGTSTCSGSQMSGGVTSYPTTIATAWQPYANNAYDPWFKVTYSAVAPGYFTTAAGAVTPCNDTNCLNCQAITNIASQCGSTPLSCATGFVASTMTGSATCVACTAANCLYCDPFNLAYTALSTTSCFQCATGYVLVAANKSCVACPTNCAPFTPVYTMVASYNTAAGWNKNITCMWSLTLGAAVCLQCNVGYTIANTDFPSFSSAILGSGITYGQLQVGGGNCVALPANCLGGVVPLSGVVAIATCFQCYPGFGLFWNPMTNMTSCNACPPNCQTCDGMGVCTQCNTNFTTVPNQCNQCPYNCSVCLNSTVCYNNCTKNYLYNAVTGQCLPNGAEKIVLMGIALLSFFLLFI